MSVFDAALFKMFFDFVKANGGPKIPWTPLEAAILNNKQLFTVSKRVKDNEGMNKKQRPSKLIVTTY